MPYVIALIGAAFLLCTIGVYAFLCASYCACTLHGQSDNPIGRYWLLAMLSQLASLGCCVLALHSHLGSLLWFSLVACCLAGAWLRVKLKTRLSARIKAQVKAIYTPRTSEVYRKELA